jgi:hypothetical protein
LAKSTPQGFDFPDLPVSTKQAITLGPKETNGLRANVPINAFRTQWEGKSRLYAWGWVVYDDIFPDDSPQLTEFCVKIVQVTIPQYKTANDFSEDPNMLMGWNINRCQQHNCNDGDCKDYPERVKAARAK